MLAYPYWAQKRRHRQSVSSGAGGVAVLFKYVNGYPLAPGASFTRSSVATYVDATGTLQTAASGQLRDSHYIGGVRTTLLEGSRTNICLQNRDLTQAAWSATNVTPAKDQTGIDGAANSASSIVATAGNGTILQSITDASKARFQSAWVKRITGSGTVNMTLDNGATWTAITVTASWARVNIPTQTLANPIVGFQIVTNGDKIAVDYVQTENGVFQSSSIATAGATVTRNADALSFPFAPVPQAMTVYGKFISQGWGLDAVNVQYIGSIGKIADATFLRLASNGSATINDIVRMGSANTSTNLACANAYGDTVEGRVAMAADASSTIGRTINGGAETTGTGAAPNPLDPTFPTPTLYVGSTTTANQEGYIGLIALKVIAGTQGMVVCRAA